MSYPHNPFQNQKIAIIGDAILDRFIYGDVERISPEAPVPVVKVSHRTSHLGGSGNVAANLASLGASPMLVARIGTDEAGRGFEDIAKKYGMEPKYLVKGDIPTITKCRIIARNQQVVRYDEEQVAALTSAEKAKVKDNLTALAKQTDVVIVSDYAKGVLDDEVMAMVKDLWAGKTILLDPQPHSRTDYTGVSCITPNLSEACLAVGEPKVANTEENAVAIGQKLIEKFQLEYVLLTRSEAGMTLVEKDGSFVTYPAKAREVFDVSGAGDTAIATFAAGLAAGLGHKEAAHLANAAGSVVVGKLGTALVEWAEIAQSLESEHAA